MKISSEIPLSVVSGVCNPVNWSEIDALKAPLDPSSEKIENNGLYNYFDTVDALTESKIPSIREGLGDIIIFSARSLVKSAKHYKHLAQYFMHSDYIEP